MDILKRFWSDENGFVVSLELIMVASVLVLGVMVGMTQIRDSINSEFNQLSQAINSLNFSYTINPVQGPNGSYTAGSSFTQGQTSVPQGQPTSLNTTGIQNALQNTLNTMSTPNSSTSTSGTALGGTGHHHSGT